MLSELRFFINSILWGVVLLVMYDILRIFRRVVKHGYVSILFQDIVYWLINSLLIYRMMYEYNNGIIRAFTIIGLFIGMILYHGSLSNMIVEYISSFLNNTLDLIKKIICRIVNTFLWPFRFLYKKVKQLFLYLYKRIGTFVKKRVKKLLMPMIIALKKRGEKVRIKLSKQNQENES